MFQALAPSAAGLAIRKHFSSYAWAQAILPSSLSISSFRSPRRGDPLLGYVINGTGIVTVALTERLVARKRPVVRMDALLLLTSAPSVCRDHVLAEPSGTRSKKWY